MTGGAGTVGSNIVKKLVERQADVTVIDNLSDGFYIVPEGNSKKFIIINN